MRRRRKRKEEEQGATAEVETKKLEEYASIVTNSTDLLKSRFRARAGRGIRCILLAEYLPLRPFRRTFGTSFPFFVFSPIFEHSLLVLVAVHGGQVRRDCAMPATEFSDTEKPFFHEKDSSRSRSPTDGRSNPPCTRIDASRRARPSDICTYESSLLRLIVLTSKTRLTKGNNTRDEWDY